eukprot:30957-Pelagococcus_subviridis.AAC.10
METSDESRGGYSDVRSHASGNERVSDTLVRARPHGRPETKDTRNLVNRPSLVRLRAKQGQVAVQLDDERLVIAVHTSHEMYAVAETL